LPLRGTSLPNKQVLNGSRTVKDGRGGAEIGINGGVDI